MRKRHVTIHTEPGEILAAMARKHNGKIVHDTEWALPDGFTFEDSTGYDPGYEGDTCETTFDDCLAFMRKRGIARHDAYMAAKTMLDDIEYRENHMDDYSPCYYTVALFNADGEIVDSESIGNMLDDASQWFSDECLMWRAEFQTTMLARLGA